MGFLMFTARVHDLISRKHNIEYRLARITKKLMDVQQYASTIGNGKVSIGDLLSSPGSMMGRTMGYLAFAHNSSMQYMQQNAPYMQQMYMQQMNGQNQSPQQQQQWNNYIMRMLYQQGRDRAAEIEKKNLNIEEQRINQEKTKLEDMYKMISQELEEAKKARDKGIQEMAPKYTA